MLFEGGMGKEATSGFLRRRERERGALLINLASQYFHPRSSPAGDPPDLLFEEEMGKEATTGFLRRRDDADIRAAVWGASYIHANSLGVGIIPPAKETLRALQEVVLCLLVCWKLQQQQQLQLWATPSALVVVLLPGILLDYTTIPASICTCSSSDFFSLSSGLDLLFSPSVSAIGRGSKIELRQRKMSDHGHPRSDHGITRVLLSPQHQGEQAYLTCRL